MEPGKGYYITKTILRFLFKLFFPYKVLNGERINANDAFLISSNHISFLDPFYIVFSVKTHRKVFFLAKSELFKNRFISKIIDFLGGFPLDRSSGHDGIKKAIDVINRGDVIGIFPEGTRSKNGKLGKPKSGIMMVASRCNADIVPVTLVTKDQKVRLFQRVNIIIGERISFKDISDGDTSLKGLRVASEMLFAQSRAILGDSDEKVTKD